MTRSTSTLVTEFYDPDGEPLTDREWDALWVRRGTDPDRSWWQKVTDVGDIEVSTVWIGLDYSFGFADAPPLPWEAMIFGGEHDQEQWRYPSREAAFAHHEWLVTALRRGIDPASRMLEGAYRDGENPPE